MVQILIDLPIRSPPEHMNSVTLSIFNQGQGSRHRAMLMDTEDLDLEFITLRPFDELNQQI